MEKKEELINAYLREFLYSTAEELELIRPHLSIKEVGKGDFFLKKGEIQTQMSYVHEGLFRRYFINKKGSEITTGFIKEKEYLTDYPAFIRQQPTHSYLQALEPSVIISLPYFIIQESYRKFKNSEMHGRLIAEKVLTILSDRVEGFLFNTAEERYLNFISNNKDLLNRISLTHLSSFLGIERQSLIRIRKKLAEN